MAESDRIMANYNYCATLSDSRWAWEFLRRNADFRRIAGQHDPVNVNERIACHGIKVIRPTKDPTEAGRWGLVFMPNPDLNGFEADVFWCSALYPRNISVHVTQRAEDEIDDIFTESMRSCHVVHLTDIAGREHLLIKGNGRVVQVECTGLSLLSQEPVRMNLTIDTLGNFDETITVIKNAHALYGDDQSLDDPVWTRATTALRNALIALDCHHDGQSYFETAVCIYGRVDAEASWTGPSRAMKDEMKRALARGKELRDGGYIKLLGSHARQHTARPMTFTPTGVMSNPIGI